MSNLIQAVPLGYCDQQKTSSIAIQSDPVFTADDDAMWAKLYSKQINNLQDKACSFFLENFKKLDLSAHRVPKFKEVSERLQDYTGWQVVPVTGLLPFESYFQLLAQRKFPSSIFLRSKHEEHLSKDPDTFHELFGHCTMLVSLDYADFMQAYAQFSLSVSERDRPLCARLMWFTTETGLINTPEGLRIFGSSIVSSYSESIYCLSSDQPVRKAFDCVAMLREPYRADKLQTVYYVLQEIQQVYDLLDHTTDIHQAIALARSLGEFAPKFLVEHNKYTNIGHCVTL